jgi:hypothetical protein
MAERLIAAVLKTAVGDEPTVGSNPSLSARKKHLSQVLFCFIKCLAFIEKRGRHSKSIQSIDEYSIQLTIIFINGAIRKK